MKIKSLFFVLLFLLHGMFSNANSPTVNDSIKTERVIIISSSLIATLGGSYLYMENAWWSEQQTSFHFDDGMDNVYALNVDKVGHVIGGCLASDFFASSMHWAGMNEKQSLLYGACFGSGLQLAIEMKDAYAPYWGFSKWDLATGSAGAFLPLAKYHSPIINAFDLKFSYWKQHNTYWDLEQQRGKSPSKYAWQDDYVNQTYWLSIDMNYFNNNIPDWLNIAIGFGLDETQYLNETKKKMGGNNEWYIAIDYDLPKMVKKWNNQAVRKIKHWLNYIKFPGPTIRISPSLEYFPFFM